MAESLQQCDITSLMICQLCEHSTNVKWKCTECNLFMCEVCKMKFHPKFKLADTHNVALVKDLQATDICLKLPRTPCKVHNNQFYCLFCHSCDQPVCPSCLPKFHQKHYLVELDELVTKYTEKIRKFDEKIETYLLPLFEAETKRLENYIAQERKDFEETIRNMDEQEVKLNHTVSSCKMKMLKKLMDEKTEIENYFSNEMLQITTNVETAKRKQTMIRNALHQVKRIDTLQDTMKEAEQLIETDMLVSDKLKNPPKLSTFIPATITQKDICLAYGLLQHKFRITVSYKNSFSVKVRNIVQMRLGRKNEIWVSSGLLQKTFMYCMNPDLQCIKELKDKQTYSLFDLSPLSTEEILFTTVQPDCNVYIATSDGVKKFLSFSPLIPVALCNDEEGNILVSLRDNGPVYRLLDQSVRQVSLINVKNKKVIKTFGKECGNPCMTTLFTNATRIRSDLNYIFIIDALSRKLDGRLIAISTTENKLVWEYSGKVEKFLDFTPCDLVIIHETVIVLDKRNNAMHVLERKGVLVKIIPTDDFGVASPCCLDTDTSAQLWMGCEKERDEKFSKIYLWSFAKSVASS